MRLLLFCIAVTLGSLIMSIHHTVKGECGTATSLHARLITGFVTRLTRRVPPVEQELLTLPEHLSLPPVFSGVRFTRSLVLYICFVDRCLSFCTFSFGHCVVCSSSIYGFWLPRWYLQTLLTSNDKSGQLCHFDVIWCVAFHFHFEIQFLIKQILKWHLSLTSLRYLNAWYLLSSKPH